MESVFLKPVQQRVDTLSKWIDECTHKELEHLFPILVDNIFGESNGVGWGLHTIQYVGYNTEFDLLFKFLHPHGPVFRLCYKLLSDIYLKYDFPLTYLPMKLKYLIDEGRAPSFYMDKIQLDPKTRQPAILHLNPFEYYMFHFVFHMINPWLEVNRNESTAFQSQSLYLKLVEHYLLIFLPLDGSPVQPLTTQFMVQVVNRTLTTIPANKPARTPTLFRPDVLQKLNATMQTNAQTAPHLEIWRSQLIAQLCIEFWLSVPSTDNMWYRHPNQAWSTFPPPPHKYKQQEASNTGSSQLVPLLGSPHTLPSGQHLRVVRCMIKHLHYFSNSRQNDTSAMDELKRIIIPLSQNKIYQFLKESIQRWPLDASFRFILETWLSYIQPWRYIHEKPNTSQQEGEDIIDQKWLPFIAENLLAYTFLFHELLSRFSRLELHTPRNAVMLFRVSKVFSQPNLNILIQEVESSLGKVDSKGGSNPWDSVVRTHLEQERPGFQYSPLFCDEIKTKITKFLEDILQAEELARREIETIIENQRLTSVSIFRWLFPRHINQEYANEERKRVPVFLESAFHNICIMFNLDEHQMKESSKLNITSASNVAHQSGFEHTPEEMRRRLRNMKYEGDPDLKPIQSFEVVFLVRMLYHLASWINFEYGREIQDYYTRNDLLGGIARQILWGPTTIFYFDKRVRGYAPRVSKTLPPRLSLRCWSNKRVLGLILMISIMVKLLLGMPVVLFWFLMFCLWIMYLAVSARIGRVPSVVNQHNMSSMSES